MIRQDAYVRFANVQKTYDGETLAVKDLNLDITLGEFVTLLGPSGSGKTTSLMMLAGFEVPTQGEIFLDGSPIHHVAPHRRGIGVVFQNYALFPHLTVAENVAFPLRVRGVRKAHAAALVRQALDMVQLGTLGARRPGQLSGGQQQRVALARALVFEPKLVLMDEPLGALDKQLREHMQYEIKRLHEHLGITVVYVTHDQGEALTLSHRIAVFDRGMVQQLATPEVLYEAPENAFVAQFIGENNTLPGRVRSFDGTTCAVMLDDGGVVQALAVNAAGVGERTTVSLRPERVVLNPRRGSCPNLFEAKVEERLYLGDHMRARLNVCGTSEFIVKVPNVAGRIALQPGDTVTIGWQIADCRALDAPA